MNNSYRQTIQEDEIDLRELFNTLIKNKNKIILITLAITFVATVYALMKNPIPIYQGKVLLEIGEIQSENFGTSYFDDPNNLSTVMSSKFKNISASTPKSTNNLMELIASNSNKILIKDDLNNAITFVLNRHKEKASFYSNYIMTKQIGNININNTPINTPKKKLIIVVAFITGLILSIFLVFFLEFIRNEKEHQIN